MNALAIASLLSVALAAAPKCGPGGDVTKDKLKEHSALCAGLTSECMGKIDMNNIGFACLLGIPATELAKISAETANQILSSSFKEIPDNKDVMAALFLKNDWEKNKHTEFLQRAASTKEYSKAIMEGLSGNPDMVGKFFLADNAEKHSHACPMLAKEHIGAITTSFYAKMSKDCFRKIPADAFEGFDSDRINALRPDLFSVITVGQASKIPDVAISGFTAEQLKQFGGPFSPPDATDKDAVKTYTDSHPCSQAKRMINPLKTDLRPVLKAHCKMAGPTSAAGNLKYSTGLLAFTVLVGVFLAL